MAKDVVRMIRRVPAYLLSPVRHATSVNELRQKIHCQSAITVYVYFLFSCKLSLDLLPLLISLPFNSKCCHLVVICNTALFAERAEIIF